VQYEWDNGKAAENHRKHGWILRMRLPPSKMRTAWKKSTRGSGTARSEFKSSEWLGAAFYS
jgi:hypothetical protein